MKHRLHRWFYYANPGMSLTRFCKKCGHREQHQWGKWR